MKANILQVASETQTNLELPSEESAKAAVGGIEKTIQPKQPAATSRIRPAQRLEKSYFYCGE